MTHAMCKWYGQEWRKNELLTSKAKRGYRIESCGRSGCEEVRRIWKGNR